MGTKRMKQIQRKYDWIERPGGISRATDAFTKAAIKRALRPFRRSSSAVTIRQVDESIPSVKKYKVTLDTQNLT